MPSVYNSFMQTKIIKVLYKIIFSYTIIKKNQTSNLTVQKIPAGQRVNLFFVLPQIPIRISPRTVTVTLVAPTTPSTRTIYTPAAAAAEEQDRTMAVAEPADCPVVGVLRQVALLAVVAFIPVTAVNTVQTTMGRMAFTASRWRHSTMAEVPVTFTVLGWVGRRSIPARGDSACKMAASYRTAKRNFWVLDQEVSSLADCWEVADRIFCPVAIVVQRDFSLAKTGPGFKV